MKLQRRADLALAWLGIARAPEPRFYYASSD
jgi:hypothetical protein